MGVPLKGHRFPPNSTSAHCAYTHLYSELLALQFYQRFPAQSLCSGGIPRCSSCCQPPPSSVGRDGFLCPVLWVSLLDCLSLALQNNSIWVKITQRHSFMQIKQRLYVGNRTEFQYKQVLLMSSILITQSLKILRNRPGIYETLKKYLVLHR